MNKWVFVSVIGASAVGGLLLAVLGWFFKFHLLSGFGDALIIAAFLAITVDFYVKRKLGEELASELTPRVAEEVTTKVVKNISPLIMGHFLPSTTPPK